MTTQRDGNVRDSARSGEPRGATTASAPSGGSVQLRALDFAAASALLAPSGGGGPGGAPVQAKLNTTQKALPSPSLVGRLNKSTYTQIHKLVGRLEKADPKDEKNLLGELKGLIEGWLGKNDDREHKKDDDKRVVLANLLGDVNRELAAKVVAPPPTPKTSEGSESTSNSPSPPKTPPPTRTPPTPPEVKAEKPPSTPPPTKTPEPETSKSEDRSDTPPVAPPEPKPEPPKPPTVAELVAAGKVAEAWDALLKGGKVAAEWGSLSANARKAMATGKAYGDLAQDVVKTLFDATPDGDPTTLGLVFTLRFRVGIAKTKTGGGKVGKDWDAAGLRRCWIICEKLPAEHVEQNDMLTLMTRYEGGGAGSGSYNKGKKEAKLAYDPDKIDDPNKAADEGDPLFGVTRFDKVVRHEIGHAVDNKVGGAATLCAKEENGAWKDYGANHATVVSDMLAGSTVIKDLESAAKKAVTDAIIAAMAAGKPGDTATKIDEIDDKVVSATDKTKVKADPVVAAASKCGTGKNPWYNDGNYVDVGGRYYQASYGKKWVSFSHSARAKKVSQYQFRAPGEWFAEVYATYFQPDGSGKVGTLLAGRDSSSKAWFDANVIPQEAKVAPEQKKNEKQGGEGGGGGGGTAKG
jgi:hypothetical protein